MDIEPVDEPKLKDSIGTKRYLEAIITSTVIGLFGLLLSPGFVLSALAYNKIIRKGFYGANSYSEDDVSPTIRKKAKKQAIIFGLCYLVIVNSLAELKKSFDTEYERVNDEIILEYSPGENYGLQFASIVSYFYSRSKSNRELETMIIKLDDGASCLISGDYILTNSQSRVEGFQPDVKIGDFAIEYPYEMNSRVPYIVHVNEERDSRNRDECYSMANSFFSLN